LHLKLHFCHLLSILHHFQSSTVVSRRQPSGKMQKARIQFGHALFVEYFIDFGQIEESIQCKNKLYVIS
jgi:hypothetical protein